MLIDAHVQMLTDAGIDLEVAEGAGVRSVTESSDLPDCFAWSGAVPGVVFPWHAVDGAVVAQYRPDVPVEVDGDPRKYLWPKGEPLVVNLHPTVADRVARARTVLVVEGTKQYLAAVSACPDGVVPVGVAGCWGWRVDGMLDAGLAGMVDGREVVVIFDADVSSNPNVHDAATAFAEALDVAGATGVAWVKLPAAGTVGLDDFLARQSDRPASLTRLVDKAGPLGRRPKATPKTGGCFGVDGLEVDKLFGIVTERHHLAVDRAGRLLVYVDGRFVANPQQVVAVVADVLGDRYRPAHMRTFEEYAAAKLTVAGLVIPEDPTVPWVNVANGMLDPLTKELHPHDPKHLSTVQFPVAWNPDAVCPTFDGWLEMQAGTLAADLLEATSLLLDRRPGRQRKAVFLWGPTRSGKSTYVRIIKRMVGADAVSAVTLHELASDRFASADCYGKVLNCAADLSAGHVEDVAEFKKLTGDDPVRAQHKYGHAFTFTNTALFLFSTNAIPTVGEVSRAYLARIRPFRFDRTFEGREDPAVEQQMTGELEGVLVRLTEAFGRFVDRGGYADTAETRAAIDAFAQQSDRVRLFLAETTTPSPDNFVTRKLLFSTFETWAAVNKRYSMGRHKFFDAVALAGYRETKRKGDRGFVGLAVRHEDEWGAEGAGLSSFSLARELSDEKPHAREKQGKPAPSAPLGPDAWGEVEF